jgi:hypothetical protein
MCCRPRAAEAGLARPNRHEGDPELTTLQIRNRVHDYDQWKTVFDKFDRFRHDNNVRATRVFRDLEDPQRVEIHLEFDDSAAATAFRDTLLNVWGTPQSQAQLIDHEQPTILDLVEERTLEPST